MPNLLQRELKGRIVFGEALLQIVDGMAALDDGRFTNTDKSSRWFRERGEGYLVVGCELGGLRGLLEGRDVYDALVLIIEVAHHSDIRLIVLGGGKSQMSARLHNFLKSLLEFHDDSPSIVY
ncbi:hypothetical protein D3C73_665430 [compost metagenome]